jgi:GIY-YIG catalytic domain.
MDFDKTISLLIFEGNPNGRMMCELSNWNGRVYKISRNEIQLFATRNDAQNTGVYFLFGKDEEGKNTIYIGEAERIYDRLKGHITDTKYWTDCVVLISKDNHLNKAHIKYLENEFYRMAKQVNRYEVVNNNIPTRSTVSEYDNAMLTEFVSYSKLLVSTLGYKVFESISDLKPSNTKIQDYFTITGSRGINANGILVSDGFAVLKGSTISNTTKSSLTASTLRLRETLFSNGIVGEDFKFVEDYVFSSPSLAAAIVLGISSNGRVAWKNSEGKSIKDIEESELGLG